MTAADQITTLTTKQTAVLAQMDALMSTTATEGRQLTADESTTYDGLMAQSSAIGTDLERWQAHEALMAKSATRVSTTAPGTFRATVTSNLPKGTAFIRAACAKLLTKSEGQAIQYAEERWKDTPEVALYLKAAVAAGTTTDPVWAGHLVQSQVSNEFIDLLRPATFLAQIPGLKRVPFNVKIPAQTAGGTYGWVGQGAMKPVTSLGFGTVTIGMSKIAGIVVITKELAMLSNPSAEAKVRDDMIAGIAQFMNAQFIDPAVAAVAGINPASITNGAPTAVATADPLADILGLVHYFGANGISVNGLTFLLSPANALAMSFRHTVDGSQEFPGFGVEGGSYKGMTFLASELVGANVIALQPAQILYAEDGGVEIDVSQEASVAMDSAPTGATALVSLWQTNNIGIRAERFVSWNKINPNAVRYLTGAVYPVPGATGGVLSAAPASAKK